MKASRTLEMTKVFDESENETMAQRQNLICDAIWEKEPKVFKAAITLGRNGFLNSHWPWNDINLIKTNKKKKGSKI